MFVMGHIVTGLTEKAVRIVPWHFFWLKMVNAIGLNRFPVVRVTAKAGL